MMSAACWCCGDKAPTSAVAEWEGRLNGYCIDCAHARCDWIAGACNKGKPAPSPSEESGE